VFAGPSMSGSSRTARHGRETLLDTYGATSPAEFFAVGDGVLLRTARSRWREQHPRLYHVLHEFYGQDTARRIRV